MPRNYFLKIWHFLSTAPEISGAVLLFIGIAGSGKAYAEIADLSIVAQVSPETFRPGQLGTVTLTVTNSGPDDAGSASPLPLPNLVIQRGFRIPTSSSRDIPYEIGRPIIGCRQTEDIVGPSPPPLYSFAIVWSFYFPAIPAGESRTCTFPIQFYDRPFDSFDTYWIAASSAQDPNSSSNRFDYRFIAGPTPPPTPVPGLSLFALLLLGIAVAAVAVKRATA
ncbi:putative repeat protein (TIGR01451 family) [Tahibacter aquaticus]|uniref:Putative repeat protein (TIGR01451 family) n=1 Tax=Tahibacter aquaticus TaxID=520092 RepID=A0A4R6YMI4_9GAMM|nr:putative repeat protein (TIGR01451 family) [Tahibacter aquaticus]